MSGSISAIGIEQKWAYEAAVGDVNQSGGIYVRRLGKKLPVKLIVLDDESDPGRTTAVVETLIKQHGVDFLLSGHSGPYGVIPGCVTAEKNHKYYHATASFIPPWQAHQFQWSTLYFIDLVDTAEMPFKLLNSIPRDVRPRSLAAFMEDTFDGRALGSVIRKVGATHGYRFNLEESLSPGAEDYNVQIREAKALGIDAVLLFASMPDCITFIRQMKENDFSPKFIMGWKGLWANKLWQTLGKDAEYVVSDGHWSADLPFPGSKELGERYYHDFHKYSIGIGAFYALAQTLWQAIEYAGSLDSAAVRQAVLHHRFNTIMGPVKYDEMGVSIYPALAFQWIDGKQNFILPFNFATHQLKIAPPWRER